MVKAPVVQLNHTKKPYENKLFLVFVTGFLAKPEVSRAVLLKNCWMTTSFWKSEDKYENH